jgi:hypothetical protein
VFMKEINRSIELKKANDAAETILGSLFKRQGARSNPYNSRSFAKAFTIHGKSSPAPSIIESYLESIESANPFDFLPADGLSNALIALGKAGHPTIWVVQPELVKTWLLRRPSKPALPDGDADALWRSTSSRWTALSSRLPTDQSDVIRLVNRMVEAGNKGDWQIATPYVFALLERVTNLFLESNQSYRPSPTRSEQYERVRDSHVELVGQIEDPNTELAYAWEIRRSLVLAPILSLLKSDAGTAIYDPSSRTRRVLGYNIPRFPAVNRHGVIHDLREHRLSKDAFALASASVIAVLCLLYMP